MATDQLLERMSNLMHSCAFAIWLIDSIDSFFVISDPIQPPANFVIRYAWTSLILILVSAQCDILSSSSTDSLTHSVTPFNNNCPRFFCLHHFIVTTSQSFRGGVIPASISSSSSSASTATTTAAIATASWLHAFVHQQQQQPQPQQQQPREQTPSTTTVVVSGNGTRMKFYQQQQQRKEWRKPCVMLSSSQNSIHIHIHSNPSLHIH